MNTVLNIDYQYCIKEINNTEITEKYIINKKKLNNLLRNKTKK